MAIFKTMTWWTPIGESGRAVSDAAQNPGVRGGAGLSAIAIVFFIVAELLASAAWLHPPLSRDVSSWHLSVGFWPIGTVTPPTILQGPRRVPFDSVGLLLLVVILTGAVIVYRRPERLGRVAGILLGSALAANAAVGLNHPALIEALDGEYTQRMQIAAMITGSPVADALTQNDNDRLGLAAAPAGDEQPADWWRGTLYLGLGRWLIVWAAGGCLFAARGALAVRFLHLARWSAAGLGLAGVLCFPRLIAEYHWRQAQRLETACQYEAAQHSLEAAVAWCPELESLQRTWLLAGKLDHRRGRITPCEQVFRAYQLARRKDQPRAVAYRQDLPWIITGAFDYRNDLQNVPAGFHQRFPTGTNEIETLDYQQGLPISRGPLFDAYQAARGVDTRHALGLLDGLLRGSASPPAVRDQAARLWTDVGLLAYLQDPVVSDAGYDYFPQNQNLVGAQVAWQRAAQLVPLRYDLPFYLGSLETRLDPRSPDRVEGLIGPLVGRLEDAIVLADALATLGDAHFNGGDGAAARRRYAESLRAFLLPRMINYRAQKNLGGL
jgi:hypothetical protein